ncbi:MAG: erythromycin esterase family protein [Chthoniobacterales bacterium]
MARHADKIAMVARRITGPADYEPLLETIGDRHLVLIGEASHGTHEFYHVRAELTKWLIEHKGFKSVAVEADWPDALRVHRYIQGTGNERDADEALCDFKRFPQWMWRNTVVVAFVEWLRQWNSAHPNARAGFYGMDLYGLHASIAGVLKYLDGVDPAAAKRARQRYGCFDHFADPQVYGYAAGTGMTEPCEGAAVDQLMELRHRAGEMLNKDGDRAEAEYFYAEQNARLIANAERYYRSMFRGRASSWNLRDEHMTGTIGSLLTHLNGGRAKIVVWAHNSHLGDARATEMSERGEWNVGQLVREKFGDDAFLIGFTTHHGAVTAANDWDEPADRKRVRPALADSYEEVFHDAGAPQFWLNLRDSATIDAVPDRLLERAIGVIYRPDTERWSHYFHSRLTEQFDAVIHIDETTALDPLERTPEWNTGEPAETFPSGI